MTDQSKTTEFSQSGYRSAEDIARKISAVEIGSEKWLLWEILKEMRAIRIAMEIGND